MASNEIYTIAGTNKKYNPGLYLSQQYENIFNKDIPIHIVIKDKNCGATYFA